MRLIPFIFGLVGLGMLAGAVYLWRDTERFLATAIAVEGRVTGMDVSTSRDSDGRSSTTYCPWVSFAVNGKEIRFRSDTCTSPPAYNEGEKVEVLYDPMQPAHAKIHGFVSLWLGTMILGFLGAVFSAVAAGFIISAARKKSTREWLAERGQRIEAKVNEVTKDTSRKVNGRSPWVIRAQWQEPSSGKVYLFESDAVWFDPTEFMNRERVTVTIDAQNPRRYVMDIGFLPKEA